MDSIGGEMMDTHRRYTDGDIYRHLKVLTVITCIVIAIFVGFLCYWAFYPYHPMKAGPVPFEIVYPEDKIVEQGGHITYQFTYNRTTDVIPEIQRQFIDGLVFNVAGNPLPSVISPGTGTAQVQIDVPETLPPGKYQLKIISKYQMNPIRVITYIFKTEEFEVVSGPHSDAQQDAIKSNEKEDE
jgi:hypothetical protein